MKQRGRYAKLVLKREDMSVLGCRRGGGHSPTAPGMD